MPRWLSDNCCHLVEPFLRACCRQGLCDDDADHRARLSDHSRVKHRPLVPNSAAIARVVGVTDTAVRKVIRRGWMGADCAERWALALDLDASEIWPDWWDCDCEDDDLDDDFLIPVIRADAREE